MTESLSISRSSGTASKTGGSWSTTSTLKVTVPVTWFSPVAVQTRYPIIPDEMYYNDVGAAGDRLVVKFRNTSGAAVNARVICQITPL